MTYSQAMDALDRGQSVKLPEWHGYWFKRDGKILVMTRAGEILDTPYEGYENRNDWYITDTLRNWQGIQYALDAGLMIQRLGWNGKGMFAFKRPANELPQQVIVNLNPLSEGVRAVLIAQQRPIVFTGYYCLWTGTEVCNAWVPSMTDLQADDWKIVTAEDFG